MEQLIKFLKGKKSSIGTIVGLIITYSLAQGFIGGNEATLLAGILAALGITVNTVEHYQAK